MTDAFIKAYLDIDTDMSGEITIPEMKSYIRRHNLKDSFTKTWLGLFDVDNSGTITLEEFCKGLGLEVKQVRALYDARPKPVKITLPTDVLVISSDMSMELQFRLSEIARKGLRYYTKEKDVARYIKKQCDGIIGNLWHVVIMNGQFWTWYSHEPGYSFVFRLGKYIFCIWRTPEY